MHEINVPAYQHYQDERRSYAARYSFTWEGMHEGRIHAYLERIRNEEAGKRDQGGLEICNNPVQHQNEGLAKRKIGDRRGEAVLCKKASGAAWLDSSYHIALRQARPGEY